MSWKTKFDIWFLAQNRYPERNIWIRFTFVTLNPGRHHMFSTLITSIGCKCLNGWPNTYAIKLTVHWCTWMSVREKIWNKILNMIATSMLIRETLFVKICLSWWFFHHLFFFVTTNVGQKPVGMSVWDSEWEIISYEGEKTSEPMSSSM